MKGEKVTAIKALKNNTVKSMNFADFRNLGIIEFTHL